MQSVLDLLGAIGQIGLIYFWALVLTWTVLAFLANVVLERWEDGHPLVKYRLYQALLLSLPLGTLLSAATDFSVLHLLPASSAQVEIGAITSRVDDAEQLPAGIDTARLLYAAIGLLSLASLLVAIARGVRLFRQWIGLTALTQHIPFLNTPEALGVENAKIIERAEREHDVRVAIVQQDIVPMTFGVIEPVIILPRSVLDVTSSLQMAITHELVHIRRRDALLHWIEECIEVAFVAWPVVRSVRRQIRTYREVSCDLETLSEPSFSRKAYAQLLGQFSFGGTSNFETTLGMAASPNELNRRISAMKNDKFRTISSSKLLRASLGGAAGMLFAILFVMACTDLVGVDHVAPPPPPVMPPPPPQVVTSQPSNEEVFLVVEEQPQFPGGMERLAEFLRTEIRYPDIARKAGVEGKVFVQFVVGSDGKIRDVNVVRGIGGGCDDEAIRIVKAMPDWIPGKQDGQNVPVRFSMPITFKLNA